MAFDMFLEFTPITSGLVKTVVGESVDKMHKGTVEIRSFAFGVENPTAIGSLSSGAGAGKAVLQKFTVTKLVDSASPNLFLVSATGAHFPQVNLYLRKASTTGAATGADYLVYRFKMVFVNSVGWSGSAGDDQPEESVEFAYGALQVSYATQSTTGVLAAPMITQWSQVTNTPEFVVPGS